MAAWHAQHFLWCAVWGLHLQKVSDCLQFYCRVGNVDSLLDVGLIARAEEEGLKACYLGAVGAQALIILGVSF